MAFTPNNLLKPNPNILLRDQRHAARLFADDQFRLAPKFDHLFHVAFGINAGALKTIDLIQRHSTEIGMLVKSVTLPKFTVSLDQVNQYNRKKQIQYYHKFEDLTIKFHDDNIGVINNLWQNYYSYYFADSTSATAVGAYKRNATQSFDYINTPYGLDNGSTDPFFTYIKIYQMARHEYVLYTIHNPIIKTWDHQTVDYSKKETHDFQMVIGYEAVSYSTGSTNDGTVEGFGLEHYDSSLSPLQGIADGLSASPNFQNQSVLLNNADSFLSNLVNTNQGFLNSQPRANPGTSNLLTPTVNQGVGGLQTVSFPTAQSASTSITLATPSTAGNQ
jgi:hypothetical protein